MISFFHMEVLEQIEARILEHHSAGRRIHWLGGGADALGLSALERDAGIAAVFTPTVEIKRQGGRAGGTIAGMSLRFSPPFDLSYVRESQTAQIGRTSGRERWGQYVENTVGAVALTKKKQK